MTYQWVATYILGDNECGQDLREDVSRREGGCLRHMVDTHKGLTRGLEPRGAWVELIDTLIQDHVLGFGLF